MPKKLVENLQPLGLDSLARTFYRLGRMGFWIQIVMGSIPFLLTIYVLIFAHSPSGPRAGLTFVGYLMAVNLLVLIFTTVWFYRHTRLAHRIADPESRLSASSVTQYVWTGLVASSLGLLFSMLVMVVETAHLLYYFLKVPQAGLPTFQVPGTGTVSWVSAIDMASLMALSLLVFAQVIVLIFSLWLLFRTTQAVAEFPQAPEE